MEELKSYNNMPGYSSKLHSSKQTTQEEGQPDDDGLDRLDAVLSENNTVQIGNWIYKIDSKNEEVKALYNNPEEYEKLVNNENSDKIFTFSTNQEVLSLTDSIEHVLENPEDEAAKLNFLGWFCSDKWANDDTDFEPRPNHDDLVYQPYVNAEYSARLKLKYIRRGIYFGLRYAATALRKDLVWVRNPKGYAAFELYGYAYQVRCGPYRESFIPSHTCFDLERCGNRITGTLYSGARALKSYAVQGKFYYSHRPWFATQPRETEDLYIYSF